MREIKFRAWDKTLNMMVYSKEQTGHIEYDTNPVNAINIILNEDDYGLKFMQYTGLKESRNQVEGYDKKEIYEGDIIQEDGWDDLYLIIFEDCKFIAQMIGKHNGDIFTKRDKDLDSILFPIVVGNKYANPNLLEKS